MARFGNLPVSDDLDYERDTKGKPTGFECIALIADKLQLQLKSS